MKYSFLVLILFHNLVNAQNPGPRLIAMGSGGTAIQDIWSLQQNPAGAAELKKPAFALAYERHLFMPELSTQTALFIIPYRGNVLGFSFESYGITEYREQKAGLSYSRGFGDSFRLAFAIRYFQLNISQYGSAQAVSVEAGFQLNVTDKLIIASHIANPNQSKYQNLSGLNLPVKLSFGLSFILSDRMLMITDIRKELNYPIDGTAGIEYSLIKWFSVRGGISVNPFKQYSGFGVKSKKIQFDFAVASHPSLGYTPQIGFGYEF